MSSLMIQVGIYVCVTAVLFQIMNKIQPNPFIDEVFHVPQAQKYCLGNFSYWDPMITTLPGLYISSLIILFPAILLQGKLACSVAALRFVNVIFNSCSMILASFIYGERQKIDENTKATPAENEYKLRSSVVIGIFPLLYFYSFLYYTDPGSVTLVLASYCMCLKNNHNAAAILGLISVVFRQSNIAWVFFMAGTVVADHLEKMSQLDKIAASPNLKDKLAQLMAETLAAVVKYLLVVQNILIVAKLIWSYLAVIALFCLFVYFNNGITVGDKSSHTAVLHFSQLLYVSGFILFFASPVLINVEKIKRFFSMVNHRRYGCLAGLFFIIYILLNYSFVHPYLLADNRHYTFYVWRWILGNGVFKYMLAPVYLYAIWSINDSLSSSHNPTLWKVVYAVCVIVVTVPQKLLELRYFILPYIMFRLHIKEQTNFTVLLEILLHIVINIATIFVFATKTFFWDDIVDPQRIMW